MSRRVVHRQSIARPDSGLPMCRFGATDEQAVWRMTDDDTAVTCRRCRHMLSERRQHVHVGATRTESEENRTRPASRLDDWLKGRGV